MLIVVFGTALVAFVVLLVAIDVELLLPVGLAITALVPLASTSVPDALTVIGPGALVVIVWAIRRRPEGAGAPLLVVTVVLAVIVWSAIETVVSISLVRSIGWSTAFFVLVLLPLLGRPISERESRNLTATWVALTVGLTGFGVVERALEANPLYGALFTGGEYPIVQHWSSYRITTTLGHPLSNSLFFAVGVTLAVGRFVHENSRRSLIAAAVGMVGLLLTVSRGGLIAVAVGVAVVLVAPTRPGRGATGANTLGRRITGFVTLAVGGLAVLMSPEFQERQQSWSGIASAQQRSEIGPIVLDASASMHFLGAGPGTSNGLLRALGTPVIVENSYYQLLLSLGLPGLVLVVLLVGVVAYVGLRRGNIAAIGAVGALCVAAAGFNWIEAQRPQLLFLGLLGAMALTAARSGRDGAAARWGSDGAAARSGSDGAAARSARDYAAAKVDPRNANRSEISGSAPCTKAEFR